MRRSRASPRDAAEACARCADAVRGATAPPSDGRAHRRPARATRRPPTACATLLGAAPASAERGRASRCWCTRPWPTADSSGAAPHPGAPRADSGGGALAVAGRRRGERDAPGAPACSTRHRLEASNVAHVASLDGAGRPAGHRRRRHAPSATTPRPPAGVNPAPARGRGAGSLIATRRARAAAIGAAALPLPGADMPVLALIQVRLVAELAALHDRPARRRARHRGRRGGGRRASAGGRSAAAPPASSRVAGWAVRGTVAYARDPRRRARPRWCAPRRATA